MAGQPPDPRTFETWEDAFQYPLPVVRKLEQQLRKNIDENRQKLRSLVGASYRDLLGTAGRIIEMDEQIQTVESSLSDIGRKCNARAIERVGENHAKMRATREERERGRHQAMAQTKVLQSALTVALRTIKGAGDALLAAKLIVLARLLHKTVMDGVEPPAVVEDLGRTLGTLRKKLLLYIERSIAKPSTDSGSLVRTLCAYGLVSSSSPRDVLRHFLQVRLEQIEPKADSPTESAILQILEAYKQTLSDTRALFPRAFAESVSQLGKLPLLQDEEVRSLHELNLDVYGAWIAPTLQSFTPWVRHEQLLASEIPQGVSAWSKQVQMCISGTVTAYLETETDARSVLSARKRVISQYLALGARLNDPDHMQAIRDLQSVFLTKLIKFAEECAHRGEAAVENVTRSRPGTASKAHGDLWQLASKDYDNSHGAATLRNAVLQRRYGRDERIQAVCQRLDSWVRDLNGFSELIQQMRSTKWGDDADIDFDDLEDGDALLDVLVRQDPEELRPKLRKATSDTLHHLYEWVRRTSNSGSEAEAAMPLRLLRELHRRQQDLVDSIGITDDSSDIYNGLASSLHHSLAGAVSDRVLKQHASRRKNYVVTPVSLWDGSPPLPVQPSPATFRLLTSLQRAMSDTGHDLWSPDAVGVLKGLLDSKLSEELAGDTAREGQESKPMVNGHTQNDDVMTNGDQDEAAHVNTDIIVDGTTHVGGGRRLQQKQLLFDVLYLQRILSPRAANDAALQKLAAQLAAKLDVDETSNERLRKSANEYWKRTYLLLGLLAPNFT